MSIFNGVPPSRDFKFTSEMDTIFALAFGSYPYPPPKPMTKVISGKTFRRIDNEAVRTYVYSDAEEVSIVHPKWVHVRDSGAHNVIDSDGKIHYLPCDYVTFNWTVRPGQPEILF